MSTLQHDELLTQSEILEKYLSGEHIRDRAAGP